MLKLVALFIIEFYQKFLSPLKGFCCAYRFHTGHASCSALGFRAIRRYGAWKGYGVLRFRFERCRIAHQRYSRPKLQYRKQGGFCDVPCDIPCDVPCDGPDLRCGKILGDLGSCPCDCGGKGDKKNKKKDKEIYIPPSRYKKIEK